MLIYIGILLLLWLGLLIKDEKVKKIYLFIELIILICVSGFRSVGTDYDSYKYFYLYVESGVCERLDFGCRLLMQIVYMFFKEKYMFFFLIAAIITLVYTYKGIKFNSCDKLLSIFVFVTLGFYTQSFNIMKQFIALAITFYAIKYIIKNEKIKYIICIIIASLIHQTSLILLPAAVFCKGNFKFKKLIGMFCVSVLAILCFDKVFDIITSIDQYKMYKTYAVGIEAGLGTYLNILFFSIIIIFCALVLRKKEVLENKKINVYMNMTLFSVPFLICSIKNVLFFRIAQYFLIYLSLVIPVVFKELKGKYWLSVKLIIIIIFSMYFLFSAYAFGEVCPYKSIFS